MRVWSTLLGVLVLGMLATPALATPGDRDPTFSRDGVARPHFGARSRATATVVDGAGRVWVAGTAGGEGARRLALARLSADGRLDRSFAGDGTAMPDLGTVGDDVDIQVTGEGQTIVSGTRNGGFFAVRVSEDGSLDPEFAGGVAEVAFDDAAVARDSAIAPDGSIVIAGSTQSPLGRQKDMAFARLTADGQPDTSFSGDGRATVSAPAGYSALIARGVSIQPDGAVVGAGGVQGYEEVLAVARLSLNGELDPTLAGDGLAIFDGDPARLPPVADVVIDDAGRILTAATGQMIRLLPDGAVDPSFDRLAGGYNPSRYVALDSTGRIVSATDSGGCFRGCTDFDVIVARRLADGARDPSFGWRGLAFADLVKRDDFANALAIQRDDRIVVAGESGHRMVVFRFEIAPGKPDSDADGRVNKRDRCQYRFARTRDGCPAFSRSLTFRRSVSRDLFFGALRSRELKCVNRRKIEILRREPGFDKILHTVTTAVDGRWSVDASLEPGVYYARVDGQFSSRIGHCGPATSNEIRIR